MHDHHAHEAMMMTPAFLVDGCARCAELATDPLGLDTTHIAALWPVMVRHYSGHWREVPEDTRAPLSRAEADACRQLYTIAVFLERFAGVNPWAWPIAPAHGRIDWQAMWTEQLLDLRRAADQEVSRRLRGRLGAPTAPIDPVDESCKVVNMDNHRAAAGGEG